MNEALFVSISNESTAMCEILSFYIDICLLTKKHKLISTKFIQILQNVLQFKSS